LAAVILGLQLLGFYDLEPTRETSLMLIGAMGAVALFGFGLTTFMSEVWRRRHEPRWMFHKDAEDATHESGRRG
jgi:hypothetical protein